MLGQIKLALIKSFLKSSVILHNQLPSIKKKDKQNRCTCTCKYFLVLKHPYDILIYAQVHVSERKSFLIWHNSHAHKYSTWTCTFPSALPGMQHQVANRLPMEAICVTSKLSPCALDPFLFPCQGHQSLFLCHG